MRGEVNVRVHATESVPRQECGHARLQRRGARVALKSEDTSARRLEIGVQVALAEWVILVAGSRDPRASGGLVAAAALCFQPRPLHFVSFGSTTRRKCCVTMPEDGDQLLSSPR